MTARQIEPVIDLIDVEVFRQSLANLTEEMAITLKRASGSSIVVDTDDFSTAIFDARRRAAGVLRLGHHALRVITHRCEGGH